MVLRYPPVLYTSVSRHGAIIFILHEHRRDFQVRRAIPREHDAKLNDRSEAPGSHVVIMSQFGHALEVGDQFVLSSNASTSCLRLSTNNYQQNYKVYYKGKSHILLLSDPIQSVRYNY